MKCYGVLTPLNEAQKIEKEISYVENKIKELKEALNHASYSHMIRLSASLIISLNELADLTTKD